MFGSGLVGMIILIPTAYICLISFDTFALITGGLIKNVWMVGALFGGLGVIAFSIFLGVGLVCLFPIHWALITRPDNILLLLALALPWIITCSFASALFAHSPRGGIHTSLAIGIGYFIIMLIPYILLVLLLGVSGTGGTIIDKITLGFTGMPWVLSALAATMEGAGVGAVFGALVGSLKYKPGETHEKEKKKKSKEKKSVSLEPTFGTAVSPAVSTSAERCKDCGAKLIPGDLFCTDCGNRI